MDAEARRLAAERKAWDYCGNEHGWDNPCHECKHLADGFLSFSADALAQAVQAERERIIGWIGNAADQVSIRHHITAFQALTDLIEALRSPAPTSSTKHQRIFGECDCDLCAPAEPCYAWCAKEPGHLGPCLSDKRRPTR